MSQGSLISRHDAETSGAVIAIIGAGAAGLMAAIHAAGSGRVILLEGTADGGRKILISGGGRCNVMPEMLDPARFVTASSPHTLRNLLRTWPIHDQRAFFEQTLGLPLVLETETGKLFPVANRARVVRDALITEARRRGVEWMANAVVTMLDPRDARWNITTADGRTLVADRVILCTGGLSVPGTGSNGFGLRRLAELGHTVHPTYPALTPLTVDPPQHADLAGISVNARIATRSGGEDRETCGGFLFTHRGYSGPAVLDISDVAVRSRLRGESRAELRVGWVPTMDVADWEAQLTPSARSTAGALREVMPARLADRLISDAAVDGRKVLAQLTRDERRRLIDVLTAYPLPWTGDEGYRKAEVTGGGIALDEINPQTMESRLHPGVFLAGELLDAFGPIGGYNFAWAWVTGRLAGLGARRA